MYLGFELTYHLSLQSQDCQSIKLNLKIQKLSMNKNSKKFLEVRIYNLPNDMSFQSKLKNNFLFKVKR